MNALLHASLRFRHAAAVFVFAMGLQGAPATARAGDLEDVRAADLRRVSGLIHADRAALDAVLAEDLSYGHSDGRLQSKSELLAALAGGAVTYQSYDGPPPSVRIHGSMALLSGVAEIDATARGTRVKFWLRYLAVYEKRDDVWRLAAYQSTRLEQAPPGLR